MPPVPAPCLLWGVWGEWLCDDRKKSREVDLESPSPLLASSSFSSILCRAEGTEECSRVHWKEQKRRKKSLKKGKEPRSVLGRERGMGGGEENKALFGVVYRENAMEYGWQRDVGKKRLRAPRCTHSASASLWAPHEKRRRRRGPDLEGASPTNM